MLFLGSGRLKLETVSYHHGSHHLHCHDYGHHHHHPHPHQDSLGFISMFPTL